jgi:CubicO group peptidase (beta-lactamase class C family)
MRKTAITTGWIILWLVVVFAFLIAEEILKTPPVERGDRASLQTYVEKKFNQALAQKQLGSAAVAIIHQGGIATEQGFGVANSETNAGVNTSETLYLLSSLSKSVTAWGIMKLVQEKKLGLDEPVLRYLKRWRFPGSETYRNKVTVRQLLSHTAGFEDGYGHSGFLPGEKLQSIEESLILPGDVNTGEPHAAIIVREPGTVMSYSSAGYAVLQLLIEEITGKEFNQYMTENVLKPLGMTKSTFSLDTIIAQGRSANLATNYDLQMKSHPHRNFANMAGVSLRSTAHDLAQLVIAYYKSNPVLTKKSLEQFGLPQPGTSSSWGLGHTLYVENNKGGYIIGHGGGAFPASGAEMRVNPATGNGIVILASGTQGLISEVADTWTYWETGKKSFDIRNVMRKRIIHAAVAMIIGIVVILQLRRRKEPM